MPPTSTENDAEDVNDFLRRIQELGVKRDQEDEERNRKLEEEILQGRKERQARRAERARSISPSKYSPANTPPSQKASAVNLSALSANHRLSPAPDLQPSNKLYSRDLITDNAMDRPTDERSPSKENALLFTGDNHDHGETDSAQQGVTRVAPSSTIALSRSSTLSWQQRPSPRASDKPRSRPLSMIATENAARSPRSTPEPSFSVEESTSMSRDQIAQSLASKDPAWFRQTSDRGGISAAYRKNQVEDANLAATPSTSSRMQLPGMERDPVKQGTSVDSELSNIDRSSTPSRNSSSNGSKATTSLSRTTLVSGNLGSPVPSKSAQQLPPPGYVISPENERDLAETGRGAAMSPAQGRMSPERLDRSPSPTKGMGGFVQSAMMKRSDSVSKRWSVQSPPGLSRGDSVASNRSIHDHITTGIGQGGNPISSIREIRYGGLSRDSSPLPPSTPTFNDAKTVVTKESERPGTPVSMKSNTAASTNGGAVAKQNLRTARSQGSLIAGKAMETVAREDDTQLRFTATPPGSPSKTNDTRRWSPTKASWLESALNKPDSPKPKPTPPPQQPIWLSELNKAKQRGSTDSTPTPPTQKHQVNIGGLLRSSQMGETVKPLGAGGFSDASSFRSTQNSQSSLEMSPQSSRNTNSPAASAITSSTRTNVTQDSIYLTVSGVDDPPSKLPETSLPGKSATPSASGKIKPETPPKKNFNVNPKLPQQSSATDTATEPEFKNMFGQLRRTKTQNYVAPDELKDNILRGKAGLNITSGPQKTDRKDEFKEAILKKKEDFKKAQVDGTGLTRTAPVSSLREAPIPEALVRKANLGRPGTIRATGQPSDKDLKPGSNETAVHNRVARDLPKPTLTQELSAPGRLQSYEAAGENSTDKFKPGLAGILARGPPVSGASNSTRNSSITNTSKVASAHEAHSQDSGPQLTHMTKGRARGPRRKAPSTMTTKTHVVETQAKKDTSRSLISSSKTLERQTETAASFERKTPISNVTVLDEPENANPQPSSPRKLDIARRSKFLEEVSNKNEKTQQQLDIPKPSSPTKKANFPEVPMKMPEPESRTMGHMPSLKEKQKPIPLPKSPTLTQKQDPARIISPRDNERSQFLQKTKPNPLPEKESSPEPNIISSKRLDEVKLHPQLGAVSSVKGTSTLFGGTSAMTRETKMVRLPTELFTRANEEVATVDAGVSAQSPVNAEAATLESNQSPSDTLELDIKPIPVRPPKPSTAVPLSSNIKSSSRQGMTTSSTAQGSEASKALKGFFNPVGAFDTFHVDSAALLSAKSNPRPKIRSLQSQFLQLSSDGKKQVVPSHQERILFESNMYLCIHTFTNSIGKKVVEVYFWVGDAVPEYVCQDAAIFAQSEAKSCGGRLVQFQQGKETAEFIEALGGIIIIRRGSSSSHDASAPYILCGRRHAGHIVFDQVDFALASLCSGFPFLIASDSGRAYLWKGKGSDIDEVGCARLVGTDSSLSGDLQEIEDGNEPVSFLSVFGKNAQIMKSAEHWRMKPKYPQYGSRLFYAESVSKKILEITPFSQSDISPSGIYVLDAFFEIYIIVGAHSQSQYTSFCTALRFAQEYGIMAAGMEDRPFVPISTVVLEGVPRDLKFVFRKWSDARMTTLIRAPAKPGLARSRSLRIMPLTAALDATVL